MEERYRKSGEVVECENLLAELEWVLAMVEVVFVVRVGRE
jgi:hypothetical protein